MIRNKMQNGSVTRAITPIYNSTKNVRIIGSLSFHCFTAHHIVNERSRFVNAGRALAVLRKMLAVPRGFAYNRGRNKADGDPFGKEDHGHTAGRHFANEEGTSVRGQRVGCAAHRHGFPPAVQEVRPHDHGAPQAGGEEPAAPYERRRFVQAGGAVEQK